MRRVNAAGTKLKRHRYWVLVHPGTGILLEHTLYDNARIAATARETMEWGAYARVACVRIELMPEKAEQAREKRRSGVLAVDSEVG